jgi:ketosteroid isomerase-like protein
MRRPLTFLVVAVVAASCAQTVNVEREKAALMAADAEWSKTTNDAARFAAGFAPDGTLSLAGAPAMKGPKTIEAAMAPMIKSPGFSLTWQATRAEVSASGDLGYTVGNYTLKTNTPSGIPVTENGKFQTTWKKIDGAWKVIEDTATSDAPPALVSKHVIVPASAVKWMDAPNLPPGAKLAVIAGDPSLPEWFTVRLQFPAGARVPPHWHPNDEHGTVLSGTLALGMGDAWDDKALTDLPAGSHVVTTATMRHYALARTATTIQVSGMGPFVTNYVNPADDPSKK